MQNTKNVKSKRCENLKKINAEFKNPKRLIVIIFNMARFLLLFAYICICVHNESKNYKMFNELICVKNNDNEFFWILKCLVYFLYISHLFVFYIFASFVFYIFTSFVFYISTSFNIFTFSHLLYSTFLHLLTSLHFHIFCIFELLYSSVSLSVIDE